MLIEAEPSEVYRYFVEEEAILEWMGEGASLDPRPGGEFSLDVEGSSIRGRFLELDPPYRLLFSWGFEGSDTLPPGTSRVEVRLTREGQSTRVDLVHYGLSGDEAAQHAAGWPRFLNRLQSVFPT